MFFHIENTKGTYDWYLLNVPTTQFQEMNRAEREVQLIALLWCMSLLSCSDFISSAAPQIPLSQHSQAVKTEKRSREMQKPSLPQLLFPCFLISSLCLHSVISYSIISWFFFIHSVICSDIKVEGCLKRWCPRLWGWLISSLRKAPGWTRVRLTAQKEFAFPLKKVFEQKLFTCSRKVKEVQYEIILAVFHLTVIKNSCQQSAANSVLNT